jgi:predicted nucleic acid-binding protein
VDGFDADVLVYAAVPGHRLGRRIRALFPAGSLRRGGPSAGVGSTLLLPEVLTKPLREGANDELAALAALLGRLDLRPLDAGTADLAVALGASYRLRAADAIHLATAVAAGADRFVTNNTRDFPTSVAEIAVTYPADLPEAGPAS